MRTRSGPTMQVFQKDAGDIVLEKRRAVTEQEHEQQALHEAEDFAEAVIDTIRVPLVVLDEDRRVVSANEAFHERFRGARRRRKVASALSNNAWDSPKLRELMEKVLPVEGAFNNAEIEQTFDRMGRRTLLLNARRVEARSWTVLAIEDVICPPKKGACIQARAALHESERRFHPPDLREAVSAAMW